MQINIANSAKMIHHLSQKLPRQQTTLYSMINAEQGTKFEALKLSCSLLTTATTEHRPHIQLCNLLPNLPRLLFKCLPLALFHYIKLA